MRWSAWVLFHGGRGDVAFMRSVAARLDAAFAAKTGDTASGGR